MADNTIVAFHSNIPSTDDLNAHLLAGKVSRPPVAKAGVLYLRLDADGYWIFGPENSEVLEGTRWSVNPMSLTVGWICWADPNLNGGKRGKLGEVMGPCSQEPAMPTIDHSERGGEWQKQYGFNLVCIDGEDEGTECAYRTSSMGGTKAYDKMYDDVLARPHPDFFFPIVELEHSSYKNKKYNRPVKEPEFRIVDWSDKAQRLYSKTDVADATNDNVVQIEEAAPAEGMQTDPAQAAGGKQRKRRVNAA